jgi:hypothetical protein
MSEKLACGCESSDTEVFGNFQLVLDVFNKLLEEDGRAEGVDLRFNMLSEGELDALTRRLRQVDVPIVGSGHDGGGNNDPDRFDFSRCGVFCPTNGCHRTCRVSIPQGESRHMGPHNCSNGHSW